MILIVTKKQDFTLSVKNKFLEKLSLYGLKQCRKIQKKEFWKFYGWVIFPIISIPKIKKPLKHQITIFSKNGGDLMYVDFSSHG